MAAVCINCNEKIGFTNPKAKCQNCDKDICNKCASWGIKVGTVAWKRMKNEKHKWYQGNPLIESYICSDNCAFKLYELFISTFTEEDEITISFVNNMDLQIWIESAQEDLYLHIPEHLTIKYMKQYGRKVIQEPGAVTIPESQALLTQIKADANNRNFKFDSVGF